MNGKYQNIKIIDTRQGSDTRVHTQKTHPKNLHFYFNLILVYTLYAIMPLIMQYFIVFKAFTQF